MTPPANWRISSVARVTAGMVRLAGIPLVKRRLASLGSFRVWEVRRFEMLSKLADSSRMSVVSQVTSLSKPPITPAMAMGPPGSVMSNMSGVRVRSTPSRVVMISPGCARRTMIAGGPSSVRPRSTW